MEAAMASGRTVRRNFMKLPQDSPFRTYRRTGGLADFWKSLRNPSCRALLPAERVADWGVCGWATCRGSIGEWTTATLNEADASSETGAQSAFWRAGPGGWLSGAGGCRASRAAGSLAIAGSAFPGFENR